MQAFLDENYLAFSQNANISESNPDPLLVVREFTSHEHFAEIALICALFSYGNASLIVKFLRKLDFGKLDFSDSQNPQDPQNSQKSAPYYRFQNSTDVQNVFKIFAIAIQNGGIAQILKDGASQGISEFKSISAILHAIKFLDSISLEIGAKTAGLDFLLGAGKNIKELNAQNFKPKNFSPLKRWNMYMRWMVRARDIDFGRFDFLRPSELVIPLDTHTFKVSRQLGLLQRKTYDLQAALELTQNLRKFDALDPVKYDFALYRIGQGKLL